MDNEQQIHMRAGMEPRPYQEGKRLQIMNTVPEKTGTISVLNPKCQICAHVNMCKNKQMALCAYVIPQPAGTKADIRMTMNTGSIIINFNSNMKALNDKIRDQISLICGGHLHEHI
jgi:hypothetical protein